MRQRKTMTHSQFKFMINCNIWFKNEIFTCWTLSTYSWRRKRQSVYYPNRHSKSLMKMRRVLIKRNFTLNHLILTAYLFFFKTKFMKSILVLYLTWTAICHYCVNGQKKKQQPPPQNQKTQKTHKRLKCILTHTVYKYCR